MAEQIFIIEDGTLTKFECDDYVEEVYIPDCVMRIGCRAFYEAPVGKVVIPDGVTAIKADAFLNCGLREIEIPDSVTTIETWAFSGCEALREITIPESVTSIGSWAIGYREDQFRPWLDPIPFGRPVIIYGKKAVKPNDIQKTITGVSTNTLPNFGRSKPTPGNWEENHDGKTEGYADETGAGCGAFAVSGLSREGTLCLYKLCALGFGTCVCGDQTFQRGGFPRLV